MLLLNAVVILVANNVMNSPHLFFVLNIKLLQ